MPNKLFESLTCLYNFLSVADRYVNFSFIFKDKL